MKYWKLTVSLNNDIQNRQVDSIELEELEEVNEIVSELAVVAKNGSEQCFYSEKDAYKLIWGQILSVGSKRLPFTEKGIKMLEGFKPIILEKYPEIAI